jgi:phosphoribosyl 1,2-cyclic phosphodiesterase
MKVRFWGVRGSIPVPGRSTSRYGGNTSCVEVRPKASPPIIIDAGTGLRRLGKALMEDAFGDGRGSASILISHTHWDHVQGLPFFSPLYRAGNQIQIFARHRDTHLEAVFSQQHGTPYFPVPLSAMQADMAFHALSEGAELTIGRAKITSTRLNHPWIALAYRIEVDGAIVVYCSDTAPCTDLLLGQEFITRPPALDAPLPAAVAAELARLRAGVVALARDADLLIYDTQFTTRPPALDEPLAPDVAAELKRLRAGVVALAADADLLIYDTQFTYDEYRLRPHWGHSHPDDAIAVARDAKVKRLCLYHHAPLRSDDDNDAILARYRAVTAAAGDRFEILSAFEGLELTLGDE